MKLILEQESFCLWHDLMKNLSNTRNEFIIRMDDSNDLLIKVC